MVSATKAEGAFLTIGELADELGLPHHILRYWETRFPQLKPLQRAGNRRYYRPEDAQLAREINRLLYQEGYTVKGVQKLLGIKPVPDSIAPVAMVAADVPVAPPLPRPAAPEAFAFTPAIASTSTDSATAGARQWVEPLLDVRARLSLALRELEAIA